MDLALTGGGKGAAKYEEKIYQKWTVTSECSSKSSPRRSHLNSDLSKERTESCKSSNIRHPDGRVFWCPCIARTECWHLGFPGGASGKEITSNAGVTGDTSLIPGSGRSSGGGNGSPLQYSCQENPMDRGAWWATVHGVTKSWTWLNMYPPTIFRLILNPHLGTAFPVGVTNGDIA